MADEEVEESGSKRRDLKRRDASGEKPDQEKVPDWASWSLEQMALDVVMAGFGSILWSLKKNVDNLHLPSLKLLKDLADMVKSFHGVGVVIDCESFAERLKAELESMRKELPAETGAAETEVEVEALGSAVEPEVAE